MRLEAHSKASFEKKHGLRSAFSGSQAISSKLSLPGVIRKQSHSFFCLAVLASLMTPAGAVGHAAFAQTSATAQRPAEANASPYRPRDPLTNSGFERFYNLDYDRSVRDFQRVVEKYPQDPFAVNHLLTAVLFRELYRMGALNTGEYANDSFVNAPHHNADPKAREQIKGLVDRAQELEQKRLSLNSKDVDALYARGVTRAQFSTYTALIEHAWLSALRNAVGARHDQERVLELSPDYVDAKLVVGAHNYVLGSLPWAVKVSASLIGLSGNKEKGIEFLDQTAKGGGEAATDAKAVLILFLRREHRYAESLQITQDLLARHPQNSLLTLEEGNLLRAMGNAQQAAAAYRGIMQRGREGGYPGQHYETATVSLGDLLRSQKDFQGAAAAYEQINDVPSPDPVLKQRAYLGAGQMYDLLRNRDLAKKNYEQVIAVNSGSERADTARKFLKEAYRE
jgi:tetratricopeptide (TPR) repeat protein